MRTHVVKLTEHDGDLVESLIASGRYEDASEVLRAGLRLLERQAQGDDEKLRVLQGLSTEAFGALDRGQGTRVEGDQQLEDFIGGVGRRAARSRARVDGGD